MCHIVVYRFENCEISQLAFVTVSFVTKRAYSLEQTVLLHPPPRYQHQAQEGTSRWVIADCMLQSSMRLAYLSTREYKPT